MVSKQVTGLLTGGVHDADLGGWTGAQCSWPSLPCCLGLLPCGSQSLTVLAQMRTSTELPGDWYLHVSLGERRL